MFSRLKVSSSTPVWSRHLELRCKSVEEADRANGVVRFHALFRAWPEAFGGTDRTGDQPRKVRESHCKSAAMEAWVTGTDWTVEGQTSYIKMVQLSSQGGHQIPCSLSLSWSRGLYGLDSSRPKAWALCVSGMNAVNLFCVQTLVKLPPPQNHRFIPYKIEKSHQPLLTISYLSIAK